MRSIPSVKHYNTRPESVPAVVQDDDYRQMVRQFDLLWKSSTKEQNQQEMQRFIALIETYEDALKIRALSTSPTASMQQARHQLQHPGCSLKGEPP